MAGPEFKELQGHVLVIGHALSGTRTGGARWHDRFFDVLADMGFKPSKADLDVWMRLTRDWEVFEYIAVNVDDLVIATRNPAQFCEELKKSTSSN